MPGDLQLDTLDVEIVSFDHWFPAEELDSTDKRCLGVLVREDGQKQDRAWPWRGYAALDDADVARLAAFRFEAPKPLIDW